MLKNCDFGVLGFEGFGKSGFRVEGQKWQNLGFKDLFLVFLVEKLLKINDFSWILTNFGKFGF